MKPMRTIGQTNQSKDSEKSLNTVSHDPKNPPWQYDKQALHLDLPRPGLQNRPLILPPPFHYPTYIVSETEPVLKDPLHSEYRKRLEERARDDSRKQKMSGQVVYNETVGDMRSVVEASSQHISCNHSSGSNALKFESRFESGNLAKAIQVGFFEYDLHLRPDQSGHVQWYYFMVSNMRRGETYIFNIVNFVKSKSLYNNGLRPLLYSSIDASKKKIGWHRAKSRCAYFSNGSKFQLIMSVSFPHDNDVCFLAHCYPYTYTDLQKYLGALDSDSTNKNFLRRSLLCLSLAQNRVELLTITDQITSFDIRRNTKPTLLLTARVHPGETQASWSMQGCIEFLISDQPHARLLRERYVIILAPMLNPDGVIDGQYRCCSVSGEDLNRRWHAPDEKRHPSIFHLKNLATLLLKGSGGGLVFFCDFHGHSTKHKAFLYGCELADCDAPKADELVNKSQQLRFPRLLSQISPAFSLSACDFRVDRSKLTTGRVVMAIELGVTSSYTLEVSFLGGKLGEQLVHFNQADLQLLGQHFGKALTAHYVRELGDDVMNLGNENESIENLSARGIASYSIEPQACLRTQLEEPNEVQKDTAVTNLLLGRFPSGCQTSEIPCDSQVAFSAPVRPMPPLACVYVGELVSDQLEGTAHLEFGGNNRSSGEVDYPCDFDSQAESTLDDSDDEGEERSFVEKGIDADYEGGAEITACDGPSLLLLRLAEPNRNQPIRCFTNFSPPGVLHPRGMFQNPRDSTCRLSTYAVQGGFLVCGSGLSKTAARLHNDEKGPTTFRLSSANSRGFFPMRRSLQNSTSVANNAQRLQSTTAAPARIVSSSMGGVRNHGSNARTSLFTANSSERNRQTFAKLSAANGESALTGGWAKSVVSPDIKQHQIQECPDFPGCQAQTLSPRWEVACLRYAAEALGECTDTLRKSSTKTAVDPESSSDSSCDMPSPRLHALSNRRCKGVCACASKTGAASECAWKLNIEAAVSDVGNGTSPWRVGTDSRLESMDRSDESDDSKNLFRNGKKHYNDLLKSTQKELPSILQARSSLRQIVMKDTFQASSDVDSSLLRKRMFATTAAPITSSICATPPLTALNKQKMEKYGWSPQQRASEAQRKLQPLSICGNLSRDGSGSCVREEATTPRNWGKCGAKGKGRVWKKSMLAKHSKVAVPLLACQGHDHPNLPTIQTSEHSKGNNLGNVSKNGKGRVCASTSTATLITF